MRADLTILALTAGCLICAPVLHAQSPPGQQQKPPREAPPKQTFTITRTSTPVRVDGVLDEPAWTGAALIPITYEWLPGDNVPPPEKTECLVTFDDDRLYLAFRAYDRDPSQIRAHLADRDTPFLDDTVGFMIDPFNDERRGFQFRINAAGVQMDAVNSDIDQTEDWSWDAIWDSVGRITSEGYIVEVAVPFSSLRFPRTSGVQTWGFVATRDLPRSLRHRMQSAYRDRNRACLFCQFDKLTGFQGITPGRNLEFDPTVTTARTDRRSTFPEGPLVTGDLKPEAGLTTRWGVTPNVTLNAAINPDFSNVEADVAQLDINTRFALFFPEKRPFFLEGADFFGTPIQAVFTRTIADPTWGAKLTGKEGKNAFGVFVARDEINNLTLPANQGSSFDSADQELMSGVLRYRRDIGGTSTIGLLYTGREASDYFNRLGGIDAVVRPSRADAIRFQYLRSSTDYPDSVAVRNGQQLGSFGGNGYSVEYSHGSREWFWSGGYNAATPEFRADSGFVPRVDYRTITAGVNRTWWAKPGQWYSRIDMGAFTDHTEDYQGKLTDWGADFPFDYFGPWQTTISYNPSPNREFFNGVTYDNFRHNFSFQIRPTGNFTFTLSGTVGQTIDFANSRAADSVLLAPTIEFSLARGLNGNLSHTFQRLHVAGGRLFEANLTQTRIVYHLNIRTFLRAIVQYTDIDRNTALYLSPVQGRTNRLFSQYLFSYKLNPQTVVLIGYSDNFQGAPGIDLTQSDRTFFFKFGYALVL